MPSPNAGGHDETESSTPYHERQHLFRCGLHAVNILLHREVYKSSDFNEIADRLAPENRPFWSHPHRSIFGLGDYDVNVLMCALQDSGLKAEWVHNKTAIRDIVETKQNLVGFLLNVAAKWKLPWLLDQIFEDRRHWIAIPRYGDHFYLADSNLRTPRKFDDMDELVQHIEEARETTGYILYVEKEENC